MTPKIGWIAGVAALALGGVILGSVATDFATAQEAPESLLPPGFDDPEPDAPPPPPPAPLPTAAPIVPIAPAAPQDPEASQPLTEADLAAVPQLSAEELEELPTLEELEELSTDELDDLLGLKPQFDIPPAARRSLAQVGLLAPEEGGFPTASLAKQPHGLVRAVLDGTRGPMVSRWGHILLRRALASRLATPDGMDPVEFATLRARVLNSIGEFTVARSLVQDVDTGNWDPAMTVQALTAYIATSDLAGTCPVVRLQGSTRDDAQWMMLRAICNAYAGEGALAASQLNAAQNREIAPEIDILLAQRYAGAAGRGRRGVNIEWDGVETLNPWRFAIANAVGEPIPQPLLEGALDGPRREYYAIASATSPMLPLADRARSADIASARGVLSASAMVDLYSEIYANNAIGGIPGQRAGRLRDAYVADDPETRLVAMRGLWGDGVSGFAGRILTAYAAARIPPASAYVDDADTLFSSMLTAGLDRDAAAWSGVVEQGSLGWALIAVADPDGGTASQQAVDAFVDDDDSEDARKSGFLIAGLAGLERLSPTDFGAFAGRLGVNFDRQTRWTRMIDRAAEVRNPALVALLAGLGMQGNDWSQMTPLHLYHITSALRSVGLEAEARMIAAEAVARG